MNRSRSISSDIMELALHRKKMAFLSGPRQCGKTTLAKMILKKPELYFNWDDRKFKSLWTSHPEDVAEMALAAPTSRLVLDEIHKSQKWKNQIKSFYDRYGENLEILVTGSAKLNVYRKGADSLLGRFVHFHLLPFTLGELNTPSPPAYPDILAQLQSFDFPGESEKPRGSDDLFEFGGFPEPLFAQSEPIYNIWANQRIELLVRQDIRDFSNILNLSQVEVLASLLPNRVGSLLSVQSLREDLDVAHTTVTRWLDALTNVYYHFSVSPYSTKVARSLKKDKKIFLYNWRDVDQESARFENMVAVHLLKFCHYYTDTGQAQLKLHYLRNKEKYEIDFLICEKNRPLFTIEVKQNELNLDRTFQRFRKFFHVPHIQIVQPQGIYRIIKEDQACLLSFDRFFGGMP